MYGYNGVVYLKVAQPEDAIVTEIPAAQQPEIPAAQQPEIPAAPQPEIPAAPQLEIPVAQQPEIPAAQQPEIPAAQPPQIPGGHETETVEVRQNLAVNHDIDFSISLEMDKEKGPGKKLDKDKIWLDWKDFSKEKEPGKEADSQTLLQSLGEEPSEGLQISLRLGSTTLRRIFHADDKCNLLYITMRFSTRTLFCQMIIHLYLTRK